MAETQEQEIEGRVYELAYLFTPMLTEESVAERFGNLKALLTDNGAAFVSEEMPKMIELAYEMSRVIVNKKTWFGNAYFGWIKFEIDPSAIAKIEEKLARDEEMVRFMIIKTVRENTIASKKVHREYRRKPADGSEGTPAPAAPINKEEVDKQIDALVAE